MGLSSATSRSNVKAFGTLRTTNPCCLTMLLPYRPGWLRISSPQMKICHATTSFQTAADPSAGLWVQELAAAQRELGYRVLVAHPPRAGILGDLARLRRWPRAIWAVVVLARRLRIAARDSDVVHAHWWPTAVLAMCVTRTPVLVT